MMAHSMRNMAAVHGVPVATWITAVGVVGADVLSKTLVTDDLAGSRVRILWGVIVLELTRNGGAAFSVGQRYTAFIALVAICAVYGIIRFSRKSSSKLFSISLGLILGGATGNLIDRLARAPGVFDGHVVDWIHIAFLPFVFNLADAAITIGAVLLVLTLLNGGRELAPLEPED